MMVVNDLINLGVVGGVMNFFVIFFCSVNMVFWIFVFVDV